MGEGDGKAGKGRERGGGEGRGKVIKVNMGEKEGCKTDVDTQREYNMYVRGDKTQETEERPDNHQN